MSDPMDKMNRFMKMQDESDRAKRKDVDFARRKDNVENMKRNKRKEKRNRKAS